MIGQIFLIFHFNFLKGFTYKCLQHMLGITLLTNNENAIPIKGIGQLACLHNVIYLVSVCVCVRVCGLLCLQITELKFASKFIVYPHPYFLCDSMLLEVTTG